MPEPYGCVVVGAGPGGYVAAIRAAQLGLRTTVVERASVGGRCLNDACIPAKAVLRAADVLDHVRTASEFGITGGKAGVDFDAIVARRGEVVSSLKRGVAALLRQHDVAVIRGEARLVPGGVMVDGHDLPSANVILATGSRRRSLPGIEFGGRVIGTEEAWRLTELPVDIAIVGAGASGVELASAYARLGSAVVLVEAREQVLPGEDRDVARVLTRALISQGVEIVTGQPVTGVMTTENGVNYTAAGEARSAEWLVVAVGRAPDVEALALDSAGVDLDETGRVAVDAEQRTSAPGVFAIGDLVAGPALAHKASDEAVVAAEAAAGEATVPVDRSFIPRVTFASPNVASAGLTEADATTGARPLVGKVAYGAVGAGRILGNRGGFVKLVADSETRALLGAHVVGPRAPELLQEVVVARELHAGVGDLARLMHGHPTLSEAVLEAARAADGWLIHG